MDTLLTGRYALYYGQPLMVDATAVDAEAFIPLRSDEEEGGPCTNQKTVYYMSQLTTILRRVCELSNRSL